MRRWLLLAAAAVVVAGTASFAFWTLRQPMNIPAAGYTLDVPAGASLQTVSSRLAANGLLEYPLFLTAYGRLTGEASVIKAGEYEIAAGTTPLALLEQMTSGRVKLHSLTIVEGWTVGEALRSMRKNPDVRQTLPAGSEEALARALDLDSAKPEGWLFPDTYRFPRGTTDRELLLLAHDRMRTILDRAWAGRAAKLPLRSPYEALILASIIEKETARDSERTRVAGVLIRRLQAGMKLQTDPTVIYGLGEEFTGDLTRRQLLRDTPYNTYTRTGLPPTPIALPSESSILAAMHPDDSDALYFVASGEDDGSHVFSATLREHNAAVKKYLESRRESSR